MTRTQDLACERKLYALREVETASSNLNVVTFSKGTFHIRSNLCLCKKKV
jgi:hypothetical protein